MKAQEGVEIAAREIGSEAFGHREVELGVKAAARLSRAVRGLIVEDLETHAHARGEIVQLLLRRGDSG